ncbi:hypothetical protein ACQKDS_01985 [Serratia sp. NPDC078593]|uniref:hypothetical protein n=1 Tax=unclassified Serratia (in: enterobacteria) TaxID=2647522 RepID=UPI0037D380E2
MATNKTRTRLAVLWIVLGMISLRTMAETAPNEIAINKLRGSSVTVILGPSPTADTRNYTHMIVSVCPSVNYTYGGTLDYAIFDPTSPPPDISKINGILSTTLGFLPRGSRCNVEENESIRIKVVNKRTVIVLDLDTHNTLPPELMPPPPDAKCSINTRGWQDLGRYSNESIKKGAFVRIQSTIKCDQDTTVSLKAVNPMDQTSFIDFKNGVRGAVNVGTKPGADGVALKVYGNQPLDPKVSVTLFGQGDVTPGRHDAFIVLQATIL